MNRNRRRRRGSRRRSAANLTWLKIGAGSAAAVVAITGGFATGAFSELNPSKPSPIPVAGGQAVAPAIGPLTKTVHIGEVDWTQSDQAYVNLLPHRLTQYAVIASHDEAQLYLGAGDADPAASNPFVAAGDFRSDGADTSAFAPHLARSATEFTQSAIAGLKKRPAAPVTDPTAELRALAAQAQRAKADGAKTVILTLIGSDIATADACNFSVAFGAVAPPDEAKACLAAAAATGEPLELAGITVRLAGVGANTDGPPGIAEYTTATMTEIIKQAHGACVVIDLDGGPLGVGTSP